MLNHFIKTFEKKNITTISTIFKQSDTALFTEFVRINCKSCCGTIFLIRVSITLVKFNLTRMVRFFLSDPLGSNMNFLILPTHEQLS